MPRPRSFRVHWANSAAKDLESIIEYLSNKDLAAAERVLGEIEEIASHLSVFPQRGRIVPELKAQGLLLYRELVHPPWRILYRIERRTVLVLAVLDSRRNLEDILLERLLH